MKLVLALLAATTLGHAQDLTETHGKTNRQILAMGYNKWYAFYTKLEGESTMGMSNALGLYAAAVADRTNHELARLGPKAAAQGKRLRKLLYEYMHAGVDLGSSFTGGGTIWHLNGASYAMDLEDAVAKLTTPTPKAPPRVVSDVTKQFPILRKRLNGPDIQSDYRKEGLESLERMEATFPKIVAEAKSLTRKQSDAVLEYCRNLAIDLQKQG